MENTLLTLSLKKSATGELFHVSLLRKQSQEGEETLPPPDSAGRGRGSLDLYRTRDGSAPPSVPRPEPGPPTPRDPQQEMAARLDEKFQQLKSRLESVGGDGARPASARGAGAGPEPQRLAFGSGDSDAGDSLRTPLDSSIISRLGGPADLSPPGAFGGGGGGGGGALSEPSFGSLGGNLSEYVQALEESRRELMRMRQVRARGGGRKGWGGRESSRSEGDGKGGPEGREAGGACALQRQQGAGMRRAVRVRRAVCGAAAPPSPALPPPSRRE